MLLLSFMKVVLVPVLIVITIFDVVLFLVIFGKSKSKNFQINKELEDEEQAAYLREFVKNKKVKKFMH